MSKADSQYSARDGTLRTKGVRKTLEKNHEHDTDMLVAFERAELANKHDCGIRLNGHYRNLGQQLARRNACEMPRNAKQDKNGGR